MKTFQQVNFFLILLFMGISAAFAGISVDSSRIIFDHSDNNHGMSVGVTSSASSTNPYLVKTQISKDIEGNNTQTPFVTTPSLFRLEPGNTHQVLIIKKTDSKELLHDRESLFYFRSVAMPAGEKQRASPSSVVGGALQVAMATVVKLFYRPGGLAIPQQQAMGMLQFSSTGQGLRVSNPSPYYITLAGLKVAGVKVPLSPVAGNTMIAPFGTQLYASAPHQGRVEWQAINDYGGTEVFNGSVR
ncbi:fimbrial biogenesis chaperone [Enterobacter cloacae]|uniref:fimbrial biogenesis chaperone n=1 Tax=Enterobacter cloacae TaxID=550 RepID=UPI002B218859|nr:molecular chaperone [Enterobacter cloacae]MEA5217558.1 molecular chaperone [Enterobacter cloacae]